MLKSSSLANYCAFNLEEEFKLLYVKKMFKLFIRKLNDGLLQLLHFDCIY